MNPRHGYLIEPLGSEYNNTKNIAGVDLVVNTTIEDAAFVNRLGVVKGLPIDNKDIRIGDLLVVHHNVFRTYLNSKGKKTKSNEYFRDGLYIVNPDRVFFYKRKDDWKPVKEYCFISPIDYNENSLLLHNEKEERHVGTVEVSNEYLESIGINKGDTVGFTKNSEYKFDIDGKVMYRMQNQDICLTIPTIE